MPPIDTNGHDAGLITGDCHPKADTNATCAPVAVECSQAVEHPFSVAGKASCNILQLHQFYASCIQGDVDACEAFTASDANAKCMTCLVHKEADSEWGPVMQASNGLYSINVAACNPLGADQACLKKKATLEACERTACASSCPGSPGDAKAQADYADCLKAAASTTCAAYAEGDCRPDSLQCRAGTDFASDFYAVSGALCADPSYCIPTQGDVPLVQPRKPTPLHQKKCTPQQVTDFVAACSGDIPVSSSSCLQWESDAANKDCLGCVETDVSAPLWGPLVATLNGSPFFYGEASCIAAVLDDPEWTKSCEAAIYQRIGCDFARCQCRPTLAPYDICAISAEDGPCKGTVAAAEACEATITAQGGDVAKCVLRPSNISEDLTAVLTLFCAD